MKTLLNALLIIIPLLAFPQEGFKPGKIDPDLVKTNVCPIDSSAGAYYILDYGLTRINSQLEVELDHVVILKILDKSELDRGDISIPYASNKSVSRLKAFTYNYEDGELITTKLDKKDIFKEEVDDNTKKLKFSMPNVREGSVIEYSYTVNYGNFRSLNTWYFQTSIPVLKSEYEILIPNYFDYYRSMTGYIPLEKADISRVNGRFGNSSIVNNHHHYVALNVPAFDNEKYIRSRNDVLSKIEFKLRSVTIPGVIHENYMFGSYGRLANKMMEDSYWSNEIDDARWAQDIIVTFKSEDKVEEATKIFNYIKNFEKSDESANSLKSCFQDKKGTDHDLNRTLIAVMREAGFDDDPILIRTRSRGRLDQLNPLRSHFNFTISRVKIDDKTYLMDASEKEHVFGVLPRYCVNGKGLVIKEGPEEWEDLNPYKSNIEMVQSNFDLSDDGLLAGNITVRRKGYDAWDVKDEIKEDGEDKYIEEFEKARENWSIESHTIDSSDPYSLNETIDLELEGKVEDLGSLLYLNPIVYGERSENPFKGTEQIYPINFGVPFSEILITEITLPEGVTVETLPEPLSMALPERAGTLLYSIKVIGNKIMINQRLTINKLEYEAADYPLLREFFARVIEKGGEQIVLKRT